VSDALNWDELRQLASRVIEGGEPLVLTDEVRDLLRRTAPQVAMDTDEAEQALRTVPNATELLREMARRIREGSHRLSRALSRMYRLRDAGDLDGARQQMRDVLAVELVPHYRSIAETSLDALEDDSQD
jgi:DUSAM domain-containing protein